MRVFLTLITLVTVLASCQKDYYLEDLNDANAKIEQLESIAAAKQQTINELEVSIAADKQTIAELNGEINSNYATIEMLEGFNAYQLAQLEITEEELATVKAQLEESIILVADLTDELNELSAERDGLVAQAEVSQEEIDSLNAAIVGLEEDLEAEKQNIKTVTVYVDRVVTIVDNTRIEALENEVEGLQAIIDGAVDNLQMSLTSVETPEGRSGSWFVYDVADEFRIQVYGRVGQERYVAFEINTETNEVVRALDGYQGDYSLETAKRLIDEARSNG